MNESKDVKPTTERQRKRDDLINEALQKSGWSGKSEFLTAILNGEIRVPEKPEK